MLEKRKLSTLSLAIIGLISKTPSSGYDIKKIFSNTPMGAFSSSPGAIYPALKRCEKNGWIRGEIDTTKALRPRQIFHLTLNGREILKEELSQHIGVKDVIWHREDLMLRFAFMDEILSKEKIITFLEEYIIAIEAYLETLWEHRKSMEDRSPKCGIFALEQGIEAYHSDFRWAKRVICEFQKTNR